MSRRSRKEYALLSLISDPGDRKLIRKIAKFMKSCDFSTNQREAAYEILEREKMDLQQVRVDFQDLKNFLADLKSELPRILKEMKEELEIRWEEEKGSELRL